MENTYSLMTVGYLAERHQTTARVVGDGLHAIGINAAQLLNGLAYFPVNDEAEEVLAAYVATRKENARRHRSTEWTAQPNIPENYSEGRAQASS